MDEKTKTTCTIPMMMDAVFGLIWEPADLNMSTVYIVTPLIPPALKHIYIEGRWLRCDHMMEFHRLFSNWQ